MKKQKLLQLFIFLVALGGMSGSVYAVDIPRLEKSVVRVFSILSKTRYSMGTGSVISRNGHVLTNHHVVRGGQKFYVNNEQLRKFKKGRVIWSSADLDLAIIHVPNLNLPTITITTALPNKGDNVYAIGFPGVADYSNYRGIKYKALDATVTKGVLSRKFRSAWYGKSTTIRILQHNADINKGNSGGPLIDDCGRQIGVNTQGKFRQSGGKLPASGIFYSSHVNEAIRYIRKQGINFRLDNNRCVISAGSGSGAGAGIGAALKRQTDIAKQKADKAQRDAVRAQQGANKAQQDAVNAKKEADKAKEDAKKAVEAALLAEQSSAKNFQTMMIWVAVLGTVTLIALAFALKKPRERIVRVMEDVAAPISRRIRGMSQVHRGSGGGHAPPPPPVSGHGIVLSGFSSDGRPVKINISDRDMAGQGFTIGRNVELVSYAIQDDTVSRRHARIVNQNGGYFIEDMNSSNGTQVNGNRLTPFQSTPFRPGDQIKIGEVSLQSSMM
jgi:hypothetical protein